MLSEVDRNGNYSRKDILNLLNRYFLMSLTLGLLCIFGSWLAEIYVSDIISFVVSTNSLGHLRQKVEPVLLLLPFSKIKL